MQLVQPQRLEISKNKVPHISFQMPALIFVLLHNMYFVIYFFLIFLNVIAHFEIIVCVCIYTSKHNILFVHFVKEQWNL